MCEHKDTIKVTFEAEYAHPFSSNGMQMGYFHVIHIFTCTNCMASWREHNTSDNVIAKVLHK